jgi:hypothetical protein
MDKNTLENWRKIRDHLERVGQTDNHYYKRAIAILGGKPDPFDRYDMGDARPVDGGRPT